MSSQPKPPTPGTSRFPHPCPDPYKNSNLNIMSDSDTGERNLVFMFALPSPLWSPARNPGIDWNGVLGCDVYDGATAETAYTITCQHDYIDRLTLRKSGQMKDIAYVYLNKPVLVHIPTQQKGPVEARKWLAKPKTQSGDNCDMYDLILFSPS